MKKIKYIKDVKDEVNRIAAMKGDYEAAHGAEDDLYEAVLEAIADSESNDYFDRAEIATLAYEALQTKKLDFARYCA